MSKNIPNANVNWKRHIQGLKALFTMNAFLASATRTSKGVMPSKGRLDLFQVARAEAQVRGTRWTS